VASLKVCNFGPVKAGYAANGGFLDLPRVAVFVGNQGSGKSTIAKLISGFAWIEKVLVRGDYAADWFTVDRFRETSLAYHRLSSYLRPDSELVWLGNAFVITYEKSRLRIEKNPDNHYALPQILYIPAERDFVSNVENPQKYKDISEALKEFVNEYTSAVRKLDAQVKLPLGDTAVEYKKPDDTVYLVGKGYRIKLIETSSGFQSAVPLFLASRHLRESVRGQRTRPEMSVEEKSRFGELSTKILADKTLSDEQKRIALSEAGKRFNKTVFVNIVEEPELNLYPSSQRDMLYRLLAFTNTEKDNRLVMTTHSPYLIDYLTLAVKAHALNTKGCAGVETARIVPPESALAKNDLSIYELDDSDGSIRRLETYNGLPSDENALNRALSKVDDDFSELLEIESAHGKCFSNAAGADYHECRAFWPV
jgi:ABC-type lipoprotein export system ATPase subunit